MDKGTRLKVATKLLAMTAMAGTPLSSCGALRGLRLGKAAAYF